MSRVQFRYLIALYLLVSAASLAAGLIGSGPYSEELQAAYEAESNASIVYHPPLSLLLTAGIALLATTLAGMVGMFQFKRWGRAMSLYTTVACIAVLPIAGPILYRPLETALSELSTLLWGALLAAAYFGPLNREFSNGVAAKNPD